MNRHPFFHRLAVLMTAGILLFTTCMPAQADITDEKQLDILAFSGYGDIVSEDILYQEDFEDGDLAASDPELVNGLTWSSSGSLASETTKGYEGKILRMNSGAYVVSDQIVNESEYTVSFTIINWYNTAARVMIAYQDESNYYSLNPTTGMVFRCIDGVEEELGTEKVRALISSPRNNPSVNRYKIYFNNNGKSISISVDRDGYENRKDYEFTYVDQDTDAVSLFSGGRIKLARVDEGTSHFWVNFDSILVTKGKLYSALPRSPAKLYVDSEGDDSFKGTEAKPFKTISKAIEYSYPGDEIIVGDGAYVEPVQFLSKRIYGEEGKRLTLQSRDRHKATITGANLKYGDFVTIDGFEVVGKPIVVGGSAGVEVLNNYIHDVEKDAGIGASGVNGRVAGNYIYKTNKGINVSGTNMLIENN